LQEYKESLDPVSVPQPVLANAASGLSSVVSSLSSYNSQPTQWQSYLVPAAGQYTDAVLQGLYLLPPLDQQRAVRAVRDAADAMRETSAAAIRDVRGEVASLADEIKMQSDRVNAVTQEYAQRSAEVATQSQSDLQDLEAAIEQATTKITDQSARLDKALTNHQTAFDTAQSERSERWQGRLEEITGQVEATVTSANDQFHDTRQQQEEQAATVIAAMEALHVQAEDLLEATGRRAITTEYGIYAENERSNAFWWSVFAVVLALIGFGFIVFEIIRLGNDTPSWQATIFKITGSLAMLVVAGYAGKQGAEHRTQERDAKRTQLDINALEPFLSRLPEEQQTELRAQIANRVFARPHQHQKRAGEVMDSDAIGGVIGQALKRFTEQEKP